MQTRSINYMKSNIDSIMEKLGNDSKLSKTFKNCFYNTLDTTLEILEDGTSYVFTGDIPAMWLRDSSAQVNHYLKFSKENQKIQRIVEGLIKRQIRYIKIDSYANAFNKTPDNSGHKGDKTLLNPWVWERKYEIDSLCYPINLAFKYWKITDKDIIFDEEFKSAINMIMKQWKIEQNHIENSNYRFERDNSNFSDTLENNGIGKPVGYTGMTWSGFRPSDDACTYGYLIPSNMFAVVVLKQIEEIAEKVYNDKEMKINARILGDEIDRGIENFGKVLHPKYGWIYSYETDGLGNHNLMDDANVPSLLSIPYIGYKEADDPIYVNTRKFILSTDNPYYFEGIKAHGVGSPHTPKGNIWHIGLIIQAITEAFKNEKLKILDLILNTDAETCYMHESFNSDNPYDYTRSWFAWANSLFAELVIDILKPDSEKE